jgi:hypothetical protein
MARGMASARVHNRLVPEHSANRHVRSGSRPATLTASPEQIPIRVGRFLNSGCSITMIRAILGSEGLPTQPAGPISAYARKLAMVIIRPG